MENSIRGRGIDFEEVRLYQPGDDIRSIDWRVTARIQKTHTRVYREEKERPVILATDMRSPMFFGSQNCFKSVDGPQRLQAAWPGARSPIEIAWEVWFLVITAIETYGLVAVNTMFLS